MGGRTSSVIQAVKSANSMKPVTILGAGNQGRRLAHMWSSLGSPVHLIDREPSCLEAAKLEIERFRTNSTSSITHGMGEIITYSADDRKEALRNSWLVVECVPESLKLKREVVADLDRLADTDVIIASNSSSYTITEIAAGLSLKDSSRLVSLHSYWPPETTAIEVMALPQTRQDIISTLMAECQSHGFSPYHVKKNSNGYIYNRIWAAIKREALFVAAENVATPQEVDAIFKNVLKTRKGPFEQMDIVGLDVVHDIEEHYAELRPGLPEEPRHLLRGMIKAGKLGVKSGEGFYTYPEGGMETSKS